MILDSNLSTVFERQGMLWKEVIYSPLITRFLYYYILLLVLKWNERENAMGILPENIFVGAEKF